MTARVFEAARLDVAAFAKAGESLHGRWPLRGMERLAASAHPESPPADDAMVDWQARGELRAVRAAPAQVWLHLECRVPIDLVCQRCLQPLPARVEGRRSFRFVPGEAQAAELDADSEDDVLALTRALDLRELIEDELLLSLPLVPRHPSCPLPLPPASGDELAADEPPHPFAALAALKADKGRP